MKMRIKEFAKFSGVSVRTLHYYDEIGLLKPAYIDRHTGYRFYDGESVLRMQQILFYRELDFPLKSICKIVSSPNYDKEKALQEQKKLLTLKKERLERLIAAIDSAGKGENIMAKFDNREFEMYKNEVKEKWGKTDAYREYSEKSNTQNATDGLTAIFSEFADCLKSGETAHSQTAQALVGKLQDYITANYYTCTKQILAGLGQMYVLDERFQKNIDANGAGTAQFVSEAVKIYCQ